MSFSTADLCDQYEGKVSVAAPLFKRYGGVPSFCGPIATIKVFEDNVLVRDALSELGHGKVLVVDGGGSLNCALLGDQLAKLAQQNRWSGIVINGCIRDAAAIAQIDIGVRALDTHPRKSVKIGIGQRNIPVSFAGVNFVPGSQLYCDEDGIIVLDEQIVAVRQN
ncbi:MAG TPA: ribonuclease E activity regulator RraA [Burkholderiales bacterium]|nr:ribonuclease E activity regulator RraA [Burkholderiales bacterium]